MSKSCPTFCLYIPLNYDAISKNMNKVPLDYTTKELPRLDLPERGRR